MIINNIINFGVIIRSIGENTEKLCYESLIQNQVDSNSIHIVRNISPAYKANIRCHQIAKNQNYNWYLILDADMILKPNILSVITNVLDIVASSQLKKILFRIAFKADDYITNSMLERGNHTYNGKYNDLLLEGSVQLKKITENKLINNKLVINILNTLNKYRKIKVHGGYFTGPDHYLDYFLKSNTSNKKKISYYQSLFYHAYFQDLKEYFRQYFYIYKRHNKDIQKLPNIQKVLSHKEKYLNEQDWGRYCACLGFEYGKSLHVKNVNKEILQEIETILTQEFKKLKLDFISINNDYNSFVKNLTLDDFYSDVLYSKNKLDEGVKSQNCVST